ncbi:hypothetical protein [Mariniphaga sp.]|uniref:hypothetical protein n=1 Tax=Mariniphaga sp. TaxID=1954475 RepID=UPI003565D58A
MKASKKVKVLRPILMIFMLEHLFTGKATSQSGYHELSASWGIKSTTELSHLSEWTESFITIFSFGLVTSKTTNIKVTGPILFSWKYIPKSRWGFGVLAGNSKGSYDIILGSHWSKNQSVNHYKYSAFTISPEIDFRYIQRNMFTLYSSAAVGLTFLEEEVNRSTEKRNYADAHLSLIGLRYGQKLGAFAELGFGFKGLINFGMNLKL